MKLSIPQIIDKIVNLLEVQYIYRSTVEVKGEEKPLLLILWQESSSGLPDDLAPLVHQVFREHSGVLFRTYALSFAERQLREGNLFFIDACKPENLKYCIPGQHLPTLTEGMDMGKALEAAQDRFQKEYSKAAGFKEGALFYMEQQNHVQAAFMLHQSIELAYRLTELLAIGKEKVCHSIASHQKYIRAFIPELGALFHPEEETVLLQLLDDAYKGVRYGTDYYIRPEQIDKIYAKSETQLTMVKELFRTKWDACKKEAVEKKKENSSIALQDNHKIRKKIETLAKSKYYKSRPDSDKLFYKADFLVSGPANVLYDIAGIMKVCIIALGYIDGSFSSLIPQPHMNIQAALEHALQLMPFEEMECMEAILEEYIGASNDC
ncbi:HEPN domain-containing protein [Sinomicrobium weinanense]|uniref:HEPN domain-containing protein n=1 Tax=Sinomicrobium weinanense TaxID=2842200 RepID=A0A926Q0K4_9FLAO|nr:HEPN domain-containing protein [Sinomicrobium weinanense]MBC9794888.1 HEPN domain-containing protein [Sinomicrobium weinanense]MBU3125659.1 HEPN domain-containing protein [Sinomicrobium weinanense]